MIHRDTELRYINAQLGWGVFATKVIPAGTITWHRDPLDRVFTEAEYEALDADSRKILDALAYWKDGHVVLCWDSAKYLNHACQPNTFATQFELDIAIRRILPGEEITVDYRRIDLDEPFECLRPECPGLVLPKSAFAEESVGVVSSYAK